MGAGADYKHLYDVTGFPGIASFLRKRFTNKLKNIRLDTRDSLLVILVMLKASSQQHSHSASTFSWLLFSKTAILFFI